MLIGISLPGFCRNQPATRSQKARQPVSDTTRVNKLNKLARIYQWKEPEKSKDYAREAYLLASRLNYTKGASYALWKLGTLHELQGNYNKALYYFLESIRIHPPGENTIAKAHSFGSIANIYTSLGQYKQAESYLNESFSIFDKNAHLLGIAISYRRQGYLQLRQQRLQAAMQDFTHSLTLMQDLQDTVGIGYAHAHVGMVYFQQKKYTQALKEYKQAVELQNNIGNDAEKVYLLNHIGKTYAQTGQLSQAIESHQQALSLAKELNFKTASQEIYQNLASLYKLQGKLAEALFCHEHFLALHHELLREETKENIADLQLQYQAFEKEQEIELLKKEKEIQALKITEDRNVLYFFAAILLLLLVVYGLLYSRYILKKKANLALLAQNEAINQQKDKIEQQHSQLIAAKKVIEEQNLLLASDKVQLEVKIREKTMALMDAYSHLLQANEEMDILVYKSSHDLRGPLATMLGICNIAFLDVKEELALKYFRMLSKNATRMDTILHRLLKVNHVKHAEVHRLAIRPEELISEVMEAVAVTEGYGEMQFYLNIEPGICICSDADLIKTALENLLQNSIQYRSQLAHITPGVWLKADAFRGNLRITIKDNGIGIKPEHASKIFTLFSKGTLRSQGSGLGLYIARAAVTKIQGSIRYCSHITDATTFEVIIPNLDQTPVFDQLQAVNLHHQQKQTSLTDQPL